MSPDQKKSQSHTLVLTPSVSREVQHFPMRPNQSVCHAGEGSLADAPTRDWAFGMCTASPCPLERKPKADKPPKPEVEHARVSTLVVSPAKAKAICRRCAA